MFLTKVIKENPGKKSNSYFVNMKKISTFAAGKSYTVSSRLIPQGLTAARAIGRSDAI
jgi:hypothetical protein